MSVVFLDDFTTYSVGAQPPFGPWFNATGNGGTILGAGVNPAPTRAFQVGGSAAFAFFLPSGTWFCGYQMLNDFAGQILSLSNGDSTRLTSQNQQLIALKIEADHSISLLGGNGTFMQDPVSMLPANSIVNAGYSLPQQTWVWLQMAFGVINVSGLITVSAQVYVSGANGIQFLCGGQLKTGIPVTSLWTGTPDVNRIDLNGTAGQDAAFANVAMDSVQWNTGFPNYPVPTNPPQYVNARASQLVVEPLCHPDNPNARTSQLVIETLELPTNANARVSQLVIELLTAAPIPSGVIPQYVKRKNLLANN